MTSRTAVRRNARNRMALDPSVPKRVTPAVITNVAATAADTIQLTFSVPVTPSKKPGYTAGAGGAETVETMTQVSSTVIELTFTGEVQGTTLIVEGEDLGIRTIAGGFVPAGSYAIPTFP